MSLSPPAESPQVAAELVKKREAQFARINELVGVVEWPSSVVVNFRGSHSPAGSEAQRVGEM